MGVIETLQHRIGRADWERARSFWRFLLKRFFDDQLFASAGALSYTTLFAVVPLLAVVLAVLSVFPVFNTITDQLINFVFQNFVPSAAQSIKVYLVDYAQSARNLSIPGGIALLISVMLTMWSVERTFNHIWRVPTFMPKFNRMLMYWALLTFGSLLAVAALSASSALFSMSFFNDEQTLSVRGWFLHYLPTLLEFLTFTLAYWLIPHRRVPFRFAAMGGLLATLLFEGLKAVFAWYLRNSNYEQLYGALAVVPIFMLWLYSSWVIILFGASVASALSAFRYQPRSKRLPQGMELYGVLRLLARFEHARKQGRGYHLMELQELEPSLTDDFLQRNLSGLSAMSVVQRSESGQWLLVCDLAAVDLGELVRQLELRIPTFAVNLPQADDLIGKQVSKHIHRLRQSLKSDLELNLEAIVIGDAENNAADQTKDNA
jgi:membrane protein